MKQLLALICALTLSVTVPALAFDEYEDDEWKIPEYYFEIQGAYRVLAQDFNNPQAAELVLRDAVPAEIAGRMELAADSPMGVPEDIEEYVQDSPWAWIPDAGVHTVTIPHIRGVEDPTGYLIQMVTSNGQLAYVDLALFAYSFDYESGTVTIDFPVAGAFCVIASKDVIFGW